MKAKICHDPASKTLTIPAAALELSGMAEKEELALFTEKGSVLLLPNDPSTLELLQTVCLLDDVRSRLMELLATAARNEAEESMGRHCEKCAWANTCHAGILAPACWHGLGSTRRRNWIGPSMTARSPLPPPVRERCIRS